MKHHGRTLILGMGVLLLAALGLVGYQAHAIKHMAQLDPAVVATVDLLKVFEGVDERVAEAKEIDAQLAALVEEQARREARLAKLQADIEDFQPGTQQYQDAERAWGQDAYKYRAWSELATRKMEILSGEAVQRLYLSIKAQAQEIAEQNGYDLVLVDDELSAFVPGTEAEIMRQISARRMLFSTQVIDITDELITRMNARSAGGG